MVSLQQVCTLDLQVAAEHLQATELRQTLHEWHAVSRQLHAWRELKSFARSLAKRAMQRQAFIGYTSSLIQERSACCTGLPCWFKADQLPT